MLLTKNTMIFNPKTGYLLLDTDVFLYATDEDGEDYNENRDIPPYYTDETNENQNKQDVKRFKLYNGPIRFFRSLVELNDYFNNIDLNAENPRQCPLIYKGHLFSGKKFPLEPKNGYEKVFIIEKINNSECFVEEVGTLKEAADSIKGDANFLSDKGETDTLNDYLVFTGTKKHPVYRCIDSDIGE